MDFEPIAGTEELRKEFEDFFKEVMKDAPPGWANSPDDLATDEGWAFHRRVARELGKRGWLSLAWPKKYGGLGKSIFEQLTFNEVRAYYRAPGWDLLGVGMLAPTLLAMGTEEQREEFLPPIARGEVTWAQLWSEPEAGSDLANVQTTAVRDGDYYILNGQKVWTTGAHRADWAFALVKTSKELTRSRGLSYLLFDLKSPGVEIRPLPTMSSHSQKVEAYFNEVFLDDVRVLVKNRVGEENQGWAITRATMNFERSGLAALGEMRHSLEELIEFCKETKWRGKPLSEDPLIRYRLAEIAVGTQAGQATSRHLLWGQHKVEMGEAPSMEMVPRASSMKYYQSELGQRFAYVGCQIMGLYGQLKRESKWAPMAGKFERGYQSAPGGNILGGTTEIQKNLVAWIGLGLPRT